MKKKILIFTRCSWTYVNFRKDLIEKIDTQKFITHVVFDKTNYRFKKKKNIKYHHIPFLNPGNSLFSNLLIMYKIFILILETKPDIIHNFTARPVYMVTLINLFFRIKIINTISGFGHLLLSKSIIKKLFWHLVLKNIILQSDKIIVQNNDDFKFFKKIGFKNVKIIFPKIKNIFIKKKYQSKFLSKKKIIFLMYSRLIKEKGVYDYIEAAKKLFVKSFVEFILVGNIDLNNPSSLTKKEIKKIKSYNFLNYYPHTDKIFNFIDKSHVVVLPSYREGLPGSLLEALYFKKAVITTNVPGCRECVINGYNGFLTPIKNSNYLIKKMSNYINDKKLIDIHSHNSKHLYLKKFNKNSNLEYYKIYSELLR